MMLLEHSTRHSLPYWQLWGRCFKVALTRRDAQSAVPCLELLRDPAWTPSHLEAVATLRADLLTDAALERAQNGLAGWCAAELLRAKAEEFLACDMSRAGAAETLLERSLEISHCQGSLSWGAADGDESGATVAKSGQDP